MTAQRQLEQYLSAFRQRLERLIVARAVAVLGASALLISLIAVYFGAQRAFDSAFVNGARVVLVVAIVGIIIGLLVYPLRLLRSRRGIPDIERRAPEFDGRLETYDGMAHSKEGKRSPFLGLLAEDALGLAERVPAILRVPPLQINAPVAVAALAGLLLVGLAAFGPDNWGYGMRHLWAGWLLDDTLPPQRIAVLPGDGTVRRGGDLSVTAQAEGFDPIDMRLYAQFEPGGDWQSTFMASGPDDTFEFTFFAIRDPISYYVEAAGLRTAEYNIDVVDLPQITNIKLTYDYPEWTNLEIATEDPGNDIAAVAGTQVTVEVETDRPLDNVMLIANGQRIPMSVTGAVSAAALEIDEDGEYFFSTNFNDDDVRLSDDYFISVVTDNEPVVNVVKPGRDWRASNIEEVTVQVEASDDFGLSNVELRYSINGGDWQSRPMTVDVREVRDGETLYLEEMQKPARRLTLRGRGADSRRLPLTIESLRDLREQRQADLEEEAADEAGPQAPVFENLAPGDLISYYVLAEDREQTVQTDLFFIEVQPFDRRFTQATAGGGGGGGGGGQQQNEISERQKEILVATWNLIRERSEEESFLDQQQLEDNARMLAELQRTLAEQAQTLADRTRARQLTNADEKIAQFVESLELAAEAMDPAAENLADVALDDAVPPEQEALQHLLRAEAVFSDIQVSFQRGGGGGGGGLAGRDLSELFELEMDLEKNQYETDAPVALEQQNNSEEEVDEAIAKLQELARRQENLSRQAGRRNGLSDQERWQQEQLRRETEELRRELEQLQQRMAQQQAQQQQSGSQQGGQQQGSQQGAQQGSQQGSQQGQGGQSGGVSQQAMRDLDNALRAMDRAAQTGQSMDPEQARRAIEQARRELDQALEQMTAQRQQVAEEAFSDVAERSEALYEEQRQLAADLQSALQRALDDQIDSGSQSGGLAREDAIDLSDRKFDMQEELDALQEDIQRIAQQFGTRTPEASQELRDALADLQRSQASARLQYGARGIRQGAAQQVAAMDAVTTSALRDLQRSTEEALERARVEAVEGESRELDPNAELVAEIQSLRRQLADMTQAEGRGDQQGSDQQGGSAGGSPGNQSSDQFGGGGRFGGDRFGGGRGYYDPNRIGAWRGINPNAFQDPEAIERLREQLGDAGRDLLTTSTRLRGEGVSEEELRALRELAEALRGGLSGNPDLIAREFQLLVDLAEQLELRLRDGSNGADTDIRSEAPNQAAPGYEEAVAEYYRRLSRAPL